MGRTNRSSHRTDIVIVGWNHLTSTAKCIESVLVHTNNYHITYVDNGSDGLGNQFQDYIFDDVTKVLLPFNTGYCHGNNVGLVLSLLSDSDYVLLLNNDTWIPDGDTTWLERMIGVMERHADVGAVGAVSDQVFGYQRRRQAELQGGDDELLNLPVLIGFCLLLRKEAIVQVGLLDQRFDLDGNYSDFDYSIRLQRASWKLAIAESVFIHHEAHTTQKDLDFSANLETNKRKLFEKWDREALKLVGL